MSTTIEYEVELRQGESHFIRLRDGRSVRLVYLGQGREGRPSIGVDAPQGVPVYRRELVTAGEGDDGVGD